MEKNDIIYSFKQWVHRTAINNDCNEDDVISTVEHHIKNSM